MAILPAVYDDLQAARRDLLEAARGMTKAERDEARAEIVAAAHPNLAPKAGESLKLEIVDGVAHIPITGELVPQAESDPCGAFTASAQTEYGFIRAALAQAEEDPAVSSIALDIDSPGGDINDLDITAQAIREVTKPITSYVANFAASAAYYLGSQAEKIVALSPLAQVGSVGIVYQEVDKTGADAQKGIVRRTLTSSDAPEKRPDLTTEEGRSAVQREVDALHSIFVRRVAEGRGVTEAKVSKDFGRGGMLIAEKALAVGMIDEVRGSHLSRPAQSAGVAGSAAPATAAASHDKEVHDMDLNLDTLKAEHPDLYAAVLAEGTKAERSRREALLAFKGRSPAVDTAVEAAIASGETYDQAMPKITAAAVFSLAGENPPPIGAKTPVGAAGAAVLTADDIAAAAIVGMSLDDYRKYAPKKEE